MTRRTLLFWAALLPALLIACQDATPPPAPKPKPTVSAPSEEQQPVFVTPAGQQITGREAFISIGGVAGGSHTTVLSSLVTGYQRAGFRVHYIVTAMSFAPFSAKMAQVATEYTTAGTQLKFVAFHHTGHGWGDEFSYQA